MSDKPLIFVVSREELEGRFDPYYYTPPFKKVIEKIRTSNHQVKLLKGLVKTIKEGRITPKRSAYNDDGILFIRAQNIDEEGINLAGIKRIKKDVYEENKKSQGKVDDVILTIDGVKLGVACVITRNIGKCTISNHMVRIETIESINPNYLSIFLNSSFGRIQIDRGITGSAIPGLRIDAIEKFVVPVPHRSVQDKITQIMQDAYKQRKDKFKKAEALINSIDDYVLGKLGIKLPEIDVKRNFVVNFTTLKRGQRHDVFYYKPKYSKIINALDDGRKQGKYDLKELIDVAEFSNKVIDLTEEWDEKFKYIEIASVDDKSGCIMEFKEIMGKNAPSRARKALTAGNIIVSTLRESLKSIAIVPRELDEAIGTTGFAILKPKINEDYLFALLRTDIIQKLMRREATGAIMPAITENKLKKIKIPVPAIKIQNEIANEVKKRRHKAEQLREEARKILKDAKKKAERMILGKIN